jgi:nucleotide-binding universal stress UspA family protein
MPTAYGALYVDFTNEIQNIEDANKRASHDLLRAYAAKLPAHKYNMRGVALRGDPREELEYKVNDINADMLVMGSRGLGAFKRALIGSVSDYLIHHLNIPVIIPRASPEESIKK